MKKATIQISFPAEKLEAVRHYATEKDSNLTAELEDSLQKIYERIVPREVRGYLEVKAQAAPAKPPRASRPTTVAADSGNNFSQGGQAE